MRTSAADVARDGLTASTLCVLAVKVPLEGGVRSCRSAACIGPAQALPSIVQAFPKLLRPLAACRAAPTSPECQLPRVSVAVDTGALGREGLANKVRWERTCGVRP